MTATHRLTLLIAGVLFALSGCTAPSTGRAYADPDPGGYTGGTSLPQPYAMPDVSLTDTAGRAYNLATSPSRPVTLLFFGYTHCPDICTAVLSDLATTLQRMPEGERAQIGVIFVTTDPARDTPAAIATYLSRIDRDFVGLTGTLPTIKQVAESVQVDIEKGQKLPDGGYEVAHSDQVIGFSRRQGVVIWTSGTPIADLKHDFELLLERST